MRFKVGDKVRVKPEPVLRTELWGKTGEVLERHQKWGSQFCLTLIDDERLLFRESELELVSEGGE